MPKIGAMRTCDECGLTTDEPEGSCLCPVYHGMTGDGHCPIYVDGQTRAEVAGERAMIGIRYIFLVEKAPGAAPVWVEQADFAEHYEQWGVIRRATIAADRPLQHAAAELASHQDIVDAAAELASHQDIVDAAVADRKARAMTDQRQHALDAAEHIIKMLRSGETDDNCLSEGADVILEAAEKIASTADDEAPIGRSRRAP